MAKFSQDFDLEAVDIIADNGSVYKIKYLVVEVNFFEDIFSFACSGNVVVKDAIGIIENLKLDGSEIIQIAYGKTTDTAKNIRKFRLYKVGNRNPVGNKTAEHYTIHFTSEELFLSEQYKISKSFKGLEISTMIWNILVDENFGLNVPIDRLKWIEQSYGLYDMVVPKMKPFEAISWLSNYALPNENSGADMLFFETKDGFYFNSLKTLFDSAPLTTYKYQPSDIDEVKVENIYTILNYEFIKTYDSLDATKSGIYANRVISIDPISRKKEVTDFTKADLPGYSPGGTALNRFGKFSEEMSESHLQLVFSNSYQVQEEYINQSTGAVAKSIRVETFVPNRTAQIALANYTIMKAIVPGNSNLTVGRTLNIEIDSLGLTSDATRENDPYYSGIYLITAVRHVIQSQGVYLSLIHI